MQAQHSYSKLTGIMTHVLVWAVFGLAIFYYEPYFSTIDVPYQFWIRQTVTLGLLVIAFYTNASVLVPRFLFKNNSAWYFVIIAGMVVIIVFSHRWMGRALHLNKLFEAAFRNSNQLHTGPPRPDKINGGGLADMFTIISVLVLGISTAITVIQKWQKDNQERKELEKDKVSSELSFLKAQIQPHFFFNTLNNIYALTDTDPKLAGEAIHQLSGMMRRLLYDEQQGDKMLSQEIAFIKNYISLMRLRLTGIVKMNIDIPGNFHDMPLAPMILLPFVENAFKHGVSATQQSHIDIIIVQKDKILDVTVRNSIMKDNSVRLDTGSGIGLVNTRRRLDLLYPGKYTLDISEPDNASEYNVHLILDLS